METLVFKISDHSRNRCSVCSDFSDINVRKPFYGRNFGMRTGVGKRGK